MFCKWTPCSSGVRQNSWARFFLIQVDLLTLPTRRHGTRMRILIYGINFAPELTGIGKYTGELASYLQQQNEKVRIVTAPPYYPEWKIYPGFSVWRYSTTIIPASEPNFTSGPNLVIFRCPLWVPSRINGFSRLVHLATFALSSIPVIFKQIFWRPDVVIVIAPALFCAPGAWLVARLSGAKAWLHVQDFEVDAAFSLGILTSGILRRTVASLERFIMRRFDRVSTISSRMVERLTTKGIAIERQVLFPNWVDTETIHPLAAPSPVRTKLGLRDDAIVVLYSGNMGEKQGMDVLLDAAARLATHPHLRFVLCGDGVARARLARQYSHLKNIIWLDLQPLEELNNLLNAADIHALPQRADAADLVMPSKLTGMMASGRPTVAAAAAGTEIANAIQGAGLLVTPGDVTAFAIAIETLARDATLRARLGAVARVRAVETMGMNAILGRFERELLACAGRKKAPGRL